MNARSLLLSGACASVLFVLCATTASNAGVVRPGERVGRTTDPALDELLRDDPRLAGEVVATRSTVLEFVAPPPNGTDDEPTRFTNTFIHTVVRDAATGTLSFYYGLEGPIREPVPTDIQDVQFVRGFAGRRTDVATFSSPNDAAERSADGDAIRFLFSNRESITSFGGFVVRTDATTFEPGGSADLWFSTLQGPGGELRFIVPTFRPAGDGGPTPIPLPAGAPAALACVPLLLGAVAYHRRRAARA